MQNANQIRHDIVDKEWLANRMFVGLDMSHAGPQSLYERNARASVSDPTVVGMAFTLGPVVKMQGTFWIQEPRLTIIQDLRQHFRNAVITYCQAVDNVPNRIIIYRGGISEGEYPKVIEKEKKQIDEALQDVHEKFPHFKIPPVTIIVGQKQSNYRIVPQNIRQGGRAPEQNVPAGTVVDHTIMHPNQTDFLMVGHKTIQGTAHPVRYTVLVDEGERIPVEQLEYITYHLCYAHGVVTSPVSVPAVLYSAGDLAKRGRNNWGQHNNADGGSSHSGEGRFKLGDSENFYELHSNEMTNKIQTKFWA
jgi:hypothetical protein